MRSSIFSRFQLGLLIGLFAGFLSLTFSLRANATILTVTNGDDDGAGSLRQAIASAASGDIIEFASGVSTVTLTTDQLSINKNLTIDGGTGVTVQRSSADETPEFRIFYINSGVVAEIKHATITNGNTPYCSDDNDGAGIYVAGDLTMEDSHVYGNSGGNCFYNAEGIDQRNVGHGGGIYVAGTMMMKNSTVSNNSAGDNAYNSQLSYETAGAGGGMYVAGTLILENCTISNNSSGEGDGSDSCYAGSGGPGGGIYVSGDLTMEKCTVNNNKAEYGRWGSSGYGGGICVDKKGKLTMKNSVVEKNTAGEGYARSGGDGGGIFFKGSSLILENSMVTNNSAGDSYDEHGGDGGGIYISGGETLLIKSSTVNGNLAGNGNTGEWAGTPGGNGGGIFKTGDNTLTIKNSTISNNKAGNGGYESGLGQAGDGGGIYGSNFVLESCTVTNNRAGYDGDSENYSWGGGSGGGIFSTVSTEKITVKNSIIAVNDAQDGLDCSGNITSYDYNLIGNKSGCSFTPKGNDIVGISASVNPLIAPLAYNGGLTQTHALQFGSPAIDKGSCSGDSVTTDQRGLVRPEPSGGSCDIGAYEFDQTPPDPPVNLDLSSDDDKGISNSDNLTSTIDGLTIGGSGENGATVQLYSDGSPIGEKSFVADGRFSIDISLAGRTQPYAITAKQTDISGNPSVLSLPLIITVDTTVSPPVADLSADDDTGISNSDNITKNTDRLNITGSGEDGATVQLYDGINPITGATALVSDRRFSIYISLSQGDHAIRAKQTDPAGNLSDFSQYLDITVDTIPPNAPQVFGSTPTNNPTPTWEWISRGGGDGKYQYKLGDGEWSQEVLNTRYTPESEFSDGDYTLSVKECDAAGNCSEPDSFTVAIDTSLGDPPTGLDLAPEDDTGISNSDNITRKSYGLTITGSGENGSTVQLYDDGGGISRSAVVSGNIFSIDISLTEGPHSITARQTDIAGNESASSSPLNIMVDTIPPFGSVKIWDNRGYTNDPAPELTIFSEGAVSMRLSLTEEDFSKSPWIPYTTTYNTLDISPGQDEERRILIQFQDAAGNESAPAWDSTVYDITPPDPPLVTGEDTPTNNTKPLWMWFTGGDGNGKYRYQLNNSNRETATETMKTRYMPEQPLADGSYTLYVWERDAVGNWSEPGNYTIVTDTSPSSFPVFSDTGSPAITNDPNPIWIWCSGGGSGWYQYKLGERSAWSSETGVTEYTPGGLSDGQHTLYVRERDEPGNWSVPASRTIVVDTGKPCSEALSPSAVDDQNKTFTITYTVNDVYLNQNCNGESSGSGIKSVSLYAMGPKDTDYILTDTDTEDAVDGVFAFTAPDEGRYRFCTSATDKAGNTENVLFPEYDSETVYSSAFSGYAILAVGSVKGNEGIEAHTLAANNIYTHLIRRGFALIDDPAERWNDPLDNIKYYNPYNEEQTGEDDYSEIGSYWLALQKAITEWAPEKMKNLPAPLFIILLDHGSPDNFYLTGTSPVSSKNLDDWLDTLQEKMDEQGIVIENAETGEAEPPPIVIIFGACYSGSFIEDLSGPGRIIVASSAADEPSYRGPYNPYSGVRDGEFFTSSLFNGLGAGYNLKTAFEKAVTHVEQYTDSGKDDNSTGWNDTATQHPLLEDNGDAKGSNNFNVSGSDGSKAEGVFLGRGTGAPEPLTVTKAGTSPETPPPLNDFEKQAVLWAEVSDTARTQRVWVEIRDPEMILETKGGNQQTVELPSILLEWQDSESRYEGVYSDFSISGKYTLFFYAEDTAGIISSAKIEYLYKDKQGENGLTGMNPGDVDGDSLTDLSDAILAMKLVCGMNVNVISLAGDVNGDGKIGLEEAVYILRKLAGL